MTSFLFGNKSPAWIFKFADISSAIKPTLKSCDWITMIVDLSVIFEGSLSKYLLRSITVK